MQSSCSYKQYTLTTHAKQRAEQRLHISNNDEIKKMAQVAKRKGLDLHIIKGYMSDPSQLSNLQQQLELFELTKADINFFIGAYNLSDGKKYYYYRNNIWVFCGKKNRTICTIIPCSKEDRERAILIRKLGWEKFKTLYPEVKEQHYKSDADMKFTKLMRGSRCKF